MRPVRGDLQRAEFEAICATVRYYDGRGSRAAMEEADRRVKMLRIVAEHERRQAAGRLPALPSVVVRDSGRGH